MQHWAFRLLLVLTFVVVPVTSPGAQTLTWSDGVGGDWYLAGNWLPHVSPDDGTIRIIRSGSPIASTLVRTSNGGSVTVDGLPASAQFNGGLRIGQVGAGALNIRAGGQVSSADGIVGDSSGSTGTATVSGSGSIWADTGGLYVGNSGNGTLNIEAAGQVTSAFCCLGFNSGSTGTATVTGDGSTWTRSSVLCVGYYASGVLSIEAGGHVGNTNGYLGYWSGSTGTATVSGADSTWTNSGEIHVGSYGSGTLNIEAAGRSAIPTATSGTPPVPPARQR